MDQLSTPKKIPNTESQIPNNKIPNLFLSSKGYKGSNRIIFIFENRCGFQTFPQGNSEAETPEC